MKSDRNPQFQYASKNTVVLEKKKHLRLLTHLQRYLSKTLSVPGELHFAVGVISRDGVLFDLFVKEPVLRKTMETDGIVPGCIFSEIGYNAIARGVEQKETLASIGKENEFARLKAYGIYYAPISMLSVYEPYESVEECGIAVFAPLAHADNALLCMTAGIAQNLMFNIQFNGIAAMYYERSGKGLLTLDNMITGTNDVIVTYCNDELFKLLGMEPMALLYQPVSRLIDPPPANRKIWDIVTQNITVENIPLPVTVKGRTIELIASTDVYHQPSINARGVTFYFTTQQKMTGNISKRVANGAIKTFDDIIGNDPGFRNVVTRAKRMAMTDSNVLILGESGTGKDIFAQAIHNGGPRRDKPFVAVNCGAMPRDLIESELFGYEAGAFTGAKKNGNIGKFELASGGTIFLDEIGELPLDLQAKLLRVVEQKQLMRLGGTKLIDVDVRIVAATNARLEEMVKKKQFRDDLYYRLSTLKLRIMPLCERRGDILTLAEYFVKQISARTGKANQMYFSEASRKLLCELEWPGNIRELQNLIECIVALYPGDVILPEYILENIPRTEVQERNQMRTEELPGEYEEGQQNLLRTNYVDLEKQTILHALEICQNNRSKAAEYLGISRRTLYRRLEEYQIPFR